MSIRVLSGYCDIAKKISHHWIFAVYDITKKTYWTDLCRTIATLRQKFSIATYVGASQCKSLIRSRALSIYFSVAEKNFLSSNISASSDCKLIVLTKVLSKYIGNLKQTPCRRAFPLYYTISQPFSRWLYSDISITSRIIKICPLCRIAV